ncbi:polysaccharide deacetylase family protein [Mongoliibacter ruber]|uniref:ChbG/HpnK family deacetylase n=1 Tax=Mongoliibacter ruber TaxID=1750599 RepID=A0A2T0WVZ7_9BACT|nr:polysaccharide deacetylase family protein [Mongoliibacter ruber]PRY90873.1 hypothetical protein CLW00_101548 [Mongoliibacter ruber]
MKTNKLTIIGVSVVALILVFSISKFFTTEKFLIIHSDDLGLSSSHNSATILAMREGLVTSASLMVPCPKRDEAIELWRENDDLDIGIHLTVTNEWENYRWGGVADPNLISSLLDDEGYMYPNCKIFLENAELDEIEIELRAQIEYVLEKGLVPTHLDAHMTCLFRGSAELLFTYLKVAQDYEILAMLPKTSFEQIKSAGYLDQLDLKYIGIIDQLYIADEQEYDKKGMEQLYIDILNEVKPGFNVLLIHTSYDDLEMKKITSDTKHWGSQWREEDLKFFTSSKTYKYIFENNIQLINWKVFRKIKELYEQ